MGITMSPAKDMAAGVTRKLIHLWVLVVVLGGGGD
jgi:hypothetical protein